MKKLKQTKIEFSFGCVQPRNLPERWGQVKELIAEAMEYADGKYTLDSIFRSLLEKKMQLWIVWGDDTIYSAVVTLIMEYPGKRVLTILFCAGKHLPVWLHYMSTIIDFAKAQGCEAIEEYGREGWAKYLDKLGFEKIHTVCRLDLNNEASHEKDLYQDSI